MDDLDLIRETLGAPPPSTEATARARDRLTASMGSRDAARKAPGLRASLRSLRSPRSMRRAPLSMRWSVAGAAVVTGVVTVVLAATMVITGQPAPTTPTATSPATVSAHVSARAMLLAAASSAARAEAAPHGRYWHVRRVVAGGPYRVGTPPHQYDLLGRHVVEQWTARRPDDGSWEGVRELGFVLRTKADERAWHEAGSPRTWIVDADTKPTTWRMAPSSGVLDPVDASERYLLELGGFSLDQVQKLPTDPGQLRTLFMTRIYTGREPLAADAPASGSHLRLFEAMSELLLDVPAPPDVRAAAFRVLAEIPGVHSMGGVTDDEGRSGVGVELTAAAGGGGWRSELILDPDTHLILMSRMSASRPGTDGSRPDKEVTTLVLDAGWTDERPRIPAIP